MNEYKKIDASTENLRKYWEGASNRYARYMNYLSRGFGRFNEVSKYLQIALASYWTAKVVVIFGYRIDPNWIFALAIIGIPILIVVGWWDLYKAQKATQFVNSQHGDITQFNSYNMMVENINQNEQIIELLKDLKNK